MEDRTSKPSGTFPKMEKVTSIALTLLGILFTVACVPISFFSAVSAGFSLVIGVLLLLIGYFSKDVIALIKVSPASLIIELNQKITRAEDILEELRRVERRMALIFSELLLNKGGEHYLGGLPEVAVVNMSAQLARIAAESTDSDLDRNMVEVRKLVATKLLAGILGSQTSYSDLYPASPSDALPSANRIRERLPDSEVQKVSELVAAYERLTDHGEYPSETIARQIYVAERRSQQT